MGDFNRDGRLDLVVASSGSNGINLYLGNGDGTFTISSLSPQTGTSPGNIAVGDYNGDGIADLAVVNGSYTGSLTILLGNGDGSFTPSASSPTIGGNLRGIAVGDFNRDGVQDLVVTNYNNNSTSILLGVGDGTFGSATVISSAYFPTAVVATDLNGDGKLDLAISSQLFNIATILLGNGDGTFTAGSTPTTGNYPMAMVCSATSTATARPTSPLPTKAARTPRFCSVTATALLRPASRSRPEALRWRSSPATGMATASAISPWQTAAAAA